jgi:hypothetical protein
LGEGYHNYDSLTARIGLSAVSVPFSVLGDTSIYGNVQLFGGRREEDSFFQLIDARDDSGAPVPFEPRPGPLFIPSTHYFIGPDMSAGILRPLTERVTLDVRYRALYYYNVYTDHPIGPADDGANWDDPRGTHGLNIGVSFRF